MSLTAQYAPITSPSAGDSAPIPVTWPFAAPTDLVVYERTTATGVETEETYGVDYTVTWTPTGGTVTPLRLRPVGTSWIIERRTEITQPSTLRNGGPYNPEAVENVLNRSTLQIQELREEVPTFPETRNRTPGAPLVFTGGGGVGNGSTVGTGDLALRGDIQDDTSGLGLLLDGTAPGGAITQDSTGQHFAQNGARIHRVRDRMLIGAAADNDGAFPNVTKDWLSQEWVSGGFSTGPTVSYLFAVENTANAASAGGILSAIRTKDFLSAGTSGIPIFGVAWNDNTTLATKAWSGYFEAHRTTAAAGSIYGVEIDTRTLTASITPTPYQQGDVIGMQIASGAEWSATGQFDASAAIQIATNPKRFKVGINVIDGSLVDIGGGVTEVMAMPRFGLMSWYVAGGRSAFITSSATSVATGVSMDLANSQINMTSSSGALNFAFAHLLSAVNYLGFYSSLANNPVRILAGGTDTNIDLSLEPKGAGQVVIPISNVRNAANDVAAAALVPPVPVGGIYRNGSVLQIRVT